MAEFSDKLKSVESLLELHPQGTHFCIASQLEGYAFDAEFLKELCSALSLSKQALESIKWNTRYQDGSKDYAQIDRNLVEKAMELMK